jgi:hypothetical protein
VAWTSRPTVYVVCTKDRTIPVWRQRRMAVHADRVIDLPASHSPFLSMPSGSLVSLPLPAASQPTMTITSCG